MASPQGDLQELISVESMHGSDDKMRTAVSAEIILHGWTVIVKPASFTGIQNSCPHRNWLEFTMFGREARVVMRWDAPTDFTSEPRYLLPVISDKYEFQGLVLQRVATEDRIPTFIRLGYYSSSGLNPVLGIPIRDLEKGEDWDAKLLFAPLIRLV